MRTRLIEPSTEQILRFCAAAPIERVFLEDVARRAQGRFAALADGDGELTALCHLGSNLVPSGAGCGAFADLAGKSGARMLIGEAGAVSDLWEAARKKLPRPRLDRPGPARLRDHRPAAGGRRPACGRRPLADLDLLVPSCAAAHHEELGVDPLRRDPSGFRWRTRAQIEEGRSWLWAEDGVIRFKAEASAWTPAAVQLQQVWTDPPARRQGFAGRALRDLIRLLLEGTPTVCLFVRAENAPAIRLYESVGMHHVLDYRSVPCSVKHADPGAPRARRLERRATSSTPSLRARVSRRRASRRRARSAALLAAEPIELGVSSRLRRAQETLALALAGPGITAASSSRCSTRSASARSRAAPSPTTAPGRGRTGRTPPARAAARAAPTPRLGSPTGLEALLRRPERTVLAVSHGLPLRYVLDAADGRVPVGSASSPCRTRRPTGSSGAAVERAAATLRAWAAAPRLRAIPLLVDDGGRPSPPMHTSSMTVRRPTALLAALVALLAVAAAGCGGSAVAVPELTSLTSGRPDELRRGLGAVRR